MDQVSTSWVKEMYYSYSNRFKQRTQSIVGPAVACYEVPPKSVCGYEQERFWLGSRWEIWAPHPISSLLRFTEKKREKCNMFNSEGDQIANQDFTGVRSEVWLWASSSISSLPRRRGLSIIEKTPIIELNWLQNFAHFLCTLQTARLFYL